jgi:hypothetical protein
MGTMGLEVCAFGPAPTQSSSADMRPGKLSPDFPGHRMSHLLMAQIYSTLIGNVNETDTMTLNSPSTMSNFLTMSSRKGLVPGSVSEHGFGPGVRLPCGLHPENGAVVPYGIQHVNR